MAEATSSKSLQITIVTPEKAVLDDVAEFIVLPLYDGELGVLANHSPFVGQLGPGELRIKSGAVTRRLFVDGGFVQVRANTVNVLTASAKKPEELTDALVSAEKAKADALPEGNVVEKATKLRATEKVKGMEKVKAKPQ